MTVISSKEVATNRTEMVIEVKGEQFTKAVDASFQKNAKNIALPGFRKGKAPRAMIERAYGKAAFYDDAINALYPAAYSEAVGQVGIEPVDQADVEVLEVDDAGFTFKATVTTKPVVTLGDYKGLAAEKAEPEVTEEDIAKELSVLQERYSRIEAVEGRAAKDGDMATINFEGFVDGVAFEGGKGEGYPLPLGSGTFIPGFEEQIVGHSIGEEFDVNVTFPEQYAEATLAGKAAVFKVKLLELKEKQLPELDDEFAKDASEFDTLEEFKAHIKATFADQKETEAKEAYESKLMEQVVENMTVEIPECMYADRVRELANDFAMRLQQQGLKIEDFIRYTGESMDKFLGTFRPQAEVQVKTRLALEAIAVAENLGATAEEVEAEYTRLSESYNTTVEELRKFISEKDISQDIGCRKALDFVVENASGEQSVKAKKPAKKKAEATEAAEPVESAEEAPAPKKPRAKKAKDAE